MAKRNKKAAEKPETEITITAGAVSDDLCNYSYEITEGVGEGNTHNVKGKGIVFDDMKEAFARLNVHMAAICDAFKMSGVEVKNINNMHGHELATNYFVDSIKIKGSEDDRSAILSGTQRISCSGDHASVSTPKIPFIHSSYAFAKELQQAVSIVISEIELYHNGKFTAVEPKEEEDPKQLKLVGADNGEEEE